MMLIELTTVPDEALPLAKFRDHLLLGTGFTEQDLQDGVLGSYLRAALATIEARTGKTILQRQFAWSLFEWRDQERQPLPLAPVTDVTQVSFVDGEEIETPVPGGWQLIPEQARPFLAATGACLPTIPKGSSVKIEMLAGFGPTWESVPDDLAHAVMMLGAYYYENRNEAQVAQTSVPFGIYSLIDRYRTVRTFIGNKS